MEDRYSKKCIKCSMIKEVKEFGIKYMNRKHYRDNVCRSCHNLQATKDARDAGREM